MKIIIIGIRFARNDVQSKGYFFISLYLFLSHISYMLLKNDLLERSLFNFPKCSIFKDFFLLKDIILYAQQKKNLLKAELSFIISFSCNVSTISYSFSPMNFSCIFLGLKNEKKKN